MLELQSQPTPKGSQPLSEDEICDQVLGRRPGYSKGLGWGPKPKARRTASESCSSTSCSQSTEKKIELQAKLHEALEQIKVQDRNHQALVSQVEKRRKRGFLDTEICIGLDGVGNTLFSCWYGVGKASSDAFLPTLFSTSFCTSGYPFPTNFSFSPTFLCIESTPVSCKGSSPSGPILNRPVVEDSRYVDAVHRTWLPILCVTINRFNVEVACVKLWTLFMKAALLRGLLPLWANKKLRMGQTTAFASK
uniref:Zinc finger protein ZPR1-like protein n=1 Tax=Cucumis melo TaxID=3656 RepID=A0A9I9EBD9_CUCME